jgi:hypothetical protein
MTNLLKNNLVLRQNTGAITGLLPNMPIFIGTANGITSRTTGNRFVFCSIGDSISNTANALYLRAIDRYLFRLNKIPSFNLIYEGHSFNAATTTAHIRFPLNDLMKVADSTYAYDHLIKAVGGTTTQDMINRYNSTKLSFKTTTSYNCDMNNILVVWSGINDIRTSGSNLSADTTFKRIKRYVINALKDSVIVILLNTTVFFRFLFISIAMSLYLYSVKTIRTQKEYFND